MNLVFLDDIQAQTRYLGVTIYSLNWIEVGRPKGGQKNLYLQNLVLEKKHQMTVKLNYTHFFKRKNT